MLVLHDAYPKHLREVYRKKVGERSLDHAPIGITGRAVLDGQPQIARDLLLDPDYLEVVPGSRSEIAVPIIWCNNVIGVLDVESKSRRTFRETDRHTLETLAKLVAIALNNHGIGHILSAAAALKQLLTDSRKRWVRMLGESARGPLSALELGRTLRKAGQVEALSGRILSQIDELEAQQRLIDDIMAAAELANDRPLKTEQTNVRDLVHEAVNRLKASAFRKNVTFDLSGVTSIELWVDRKHIQHVFNNVLADALDNTAPGSAIRIFAVKQAVDRIEVTVDDARPSRLDTSDVDHALEPKFTIPGGLSDLPGLRQNIARTLTEAHRGQFSTKRPGIDRDGMSVAILLDVRPLISGGRRRR
jgi:K+-sensing histidine kinase KdpD